MEKCLDAPLREDAEDSCQGDSAWCAAGPKQAAVSLPGKPVVKAEMEAGCHQRYKRSLKRSIWWHLGLWKAICSARVRARGI